MNRTLAGACITGLICFAGLSQAKLSETESLLAEMAALQEDQTQLEQAVMRGKERSLLCGNCHGRDGNSVRDYIPNLASQNAAYLFNQFEMFANGERKDYVMEKLARNLTREDRLDIALYFSSKDVMLRPQPVPASSEGEQVYKSLCFTCHGQDGHGNGMYPRIAGQPYEYLFNTLKGFSGDNDDRSSSPMAVVIRNLDGKQLRDVAAYIASMP